MSKWKKYPEEKPNKSGRYLALIYDKGIYSGGVWNYSGKYELFNADDDFIDCAFTPDSTIYWKPLKDVEKEIKEI